MGSGTGPGGGWRRALGRAAAGLALAVLVATGGAHGLIHADERAAAAEALSHADEAVAAPHPASAPGHAVQPAGHDCSLHAAAHVPLAAPASCAVPAPAVRAAAWPAGVLTLAEGRAAAPRPRPPRA